MKAILRLSQEGNIYFILRNTYIQHFARIQFQHSVSFALVRIRRYEMLNLWMFYLQMLTFWMKINTKLSTYWNTVYSQSVFKNGWTCLWCICQRSVCVRVGVGWVGDGGGGRGTQAFIWACAPGNLSKWVRFQT